jgi:Replication initiator protein, pSAM2
MRRIDTATGRVDVVPVPCGSTREDQCRPCADKARRLRMVQCREGWHLEAEPITDRAQPTEEHKELLAARADLVTVYAEYREVGDEDSCEQIAEAVAELDTELRSLGVRGRLTPLDHHPSRSNDPPDAGRMPRTCPADRSRNGPWDGYSLVATGPRPFSR